MSAFGHWVYTVSTETTMTLAGSADGSGPWTKSLAEFSLPTGR